MDMVWHNWPQKKSFKRAPPNGHGTRVPGRRDPWERIIQPRCQRIMRLFEVEADGSGGFEGSKQTGKVIKLELSC